METKVLEVRDSCTCIPVVAIRMTPANPVEGRYLWAQGYPHDGSAIVVMRLSDQRATVDAYEWPGLTGGTRTMHAAHLMIDRDWDQLKDGDVVDARVLLGERDEAVEPEIWTEGVEA